MSKGPDGGYRLAAGSDLPPLLFDDEQAVAIAVALQTAPSSGVDTGDAADRALTTVRKANGVDAVPQPGGHHLLAARQKGSESDAVWPCYGEFLLELPAADVAPWLGDGELEPVSGALCRVRVGSWSWAGLMSWVLRFDAPFSVLGPEAFIDSLSGFAERISAARPGLKRTVFPGSGGTASWSGVRPGTEEP